jgi:hypothetical protein
MTFYMHSWQLGWSYEILGAPSWHFTLKNWFLAFKIRFLNSKREFEKNVNMARYRVVVRSSLTSQAIYHVTSIDLPKVIKHIISLICSYLWAGSDNITGGKCKDNWDIVCHWTKLGGLGIWQLKKFDAALRLSWLRVFWVDNTRALIGQGNSCNKQDRKLLFQQQWWSR